MVQTMTPATLTGPAMRDAKGLSSWRREWRDAARGLEAEPQTGKKLHGRPAWNMPAALTPGASLAKAAGYHLSSPGNLSWVLAVAGSESEQLGKSCRTGPKLRR